MNQERNEKTIFSMQELSDIKKRYDILSNIRFDITPRIIMEPRFLGDPETVKKLKEMTGYLFYIETDSETPQLMLMKFDKSNIATTIGHIKEIPQELLEKAINEPVEPPTCGMYAINDEIKDWLKKELNI